MGMVGLESVRSRETEALSRNEKIISRSSLGASILGSRCLPAFAILDPGVSGYLAFAKVIMNAVSLGRTALMLMWPL